MSQKKIIVFIFLFLAIISDFSEAQRRARREGAPAYQPTLTWDLGAAFGNYGVYSYSEIELGLNYRFAPSFNWRNVLWDRFASSSAVSALGIDSSLRYEFSSGGDSSTAFRFFAGPGVRIASSNYTGLLAEAGAHMHLGGLNVGAGVKFINYSSPGKDPITGATMPNSDTVLFLILSGGGAL